MRDRKSIGYHTRLKNDQTVRLCGGSFGGSIDLDTIERLVSAHFDVRLLPSGTGTFVDKTGRDVFLYISVDPLSTSKGQKAREELRIKRAVQEREEQAKQNQISALLDSMDTDEIIARLTTEGDTT